MKFKLSETDILSSATHSFVRRDKTVTDLLGGDHPFFSVEKAIQAKKNFPASNRHTLSDGLSQQYKHIGANASNDSAVWQNIEMLRNDNTFTVTTGQQLHLFLGPAFVISKIIAVIKQAEHLNSVLPEYKFIPIFWLASEDHDIDEIRDNRIFNHNYRWNTQQEGACGRFNVQEVCQLLEELTLNIRIEDEAALLIEDLKHIYTHSETLSEATIKLVHRIFGQFGLICVDGDNPVFKSEFISTIQKDILESAHIEAYKSFSEKMECNGLSTQLGAREINFFYLENGLRKRIVRSIEGFSVLDTNLTFSPAEMADYIQKHPEKFSPNAVMRPLYQETILPNVVYLGGNAEVNYWIQISILFIINNIAPPSLQLRPSMWIIPSKIAKWLEKQKITPSKLLIKENKLKLVDFITDESAVLDNETSAFIQLRKRIQDIVAQNNTKILQDLVTAGKTYEKTLKTAERAVEESIKQKNEQDYLKLQEIYNIYFNINNLQDRKIHSLELLIKYKHVLNTVLNAINATDDSGYIIAV